jgi:hypothetical protein
VLVEVVVRCLAVGAMFLLVPAWTHLNVAVRCVGSVPDDEVISEFVPPVVNAVVLVKRCRTAPFSRTVVKNDVGPPRADATTSGVP